MDHKLTNIEVAKVFALYQGCECRVKPSEKEYSGVITGNDQEYAFLHLEGNQGTIWYHYFNVVKISLLPLSAVSDEHAAEICSLFGAPDHQSHPDSVIKNGRQIVFDVCSASPTFQSVIYPFVYQYLISRYYAVPLFFSPGHWANGKTAVDLDIAIDKTSV